MNCGRLALVHIPGDPSKKQKLTDTLGGTPGHSKDVRKGFLSHALNLGLIPGRTTASRANALTERARDLVVVVLRRYLKHQSRRTCVPSQKASVVSQRLRAHLPSPPTRKTHRLPPASPVCFNQEHKCLQPTGLLIVVRPMWTDAAPAQTSAATGVCLPPSITGAKMCRANTLS